MAPQVTGGAPDTFAVAPSLPVGLTLSPTTGMFSGTPTTPTPHGVYTVTASNSAGFTQTTLDLTVVLARAENLAAKAPATFTDDDIRFFLGRTHFAAKPADVAAVKAVGLPAYVDAMVDASTTRTRRSRAPPPASSSTRPTRSASRADSRARRRWPATGCT